MAFTGEIILMNKHIQTGLRNLFCFGFLFPMIAIACSSTPLPKNGTAAIPENLFGMVHAGQTNSSEEYDFLDTMGVEWILATFYWGRIEYEKGNFDFSWYDSFVDTAREKGKKVIAVLAYETPWLFPKRKSKKYISPENMPLFLNFVEKTVNHYRGRVDAWSIWNEPNFMFWAGSNKDFFELSRLSAERIRQTDPAAYILGGAFWRAPKGFIKGMYKAGGMENIDALAFHPYAVNPAGSMKVYDNFLNVLSKINYTGPVWITEIGYPTGGWYPTKVSLEELPSYVVKTISGAAARGPKALLWYELFDAYNEGEVPDKRNSEHYFGLIYPNYLRKDGSFAYELCARFLPGSRYTQEFPQREHIPSNIVSFCFVGGISKNNTLILWNDRGKAQKIRLLLSAPALLYDISTGKSQPLAAETVLDIEKKPIIITWEGTDIPRLTMP